MADDEWALMQAQQLILQLTGVPATPTPPPAKATVPTSPAPKPSTAKAAPPTPTLSEADSRQEAQSADSATLEVRRVVTLRLAEVFEVGSTNREATVDTL